jgi:hypothetical protein
LAFFFPISSISGPCVGAVDCVKEEEEEEVVVVVVVEFDAVGVSEISGGSVRIHCINGEKLCVFK